MNITSTDVRSFFVKGVNLAKNTNPKILGGSAVIIALVVGLALKVFDKMKQDRLRDKFNSLNLEIETFVFTQPKIQKIEDQEKLKSNIRRSLRSSYNRKNPHIHSLGLEKCAQKSKELYGTLSVSSRRLDKAEAKFFKDFGSEISEVRKLKL